MEIHKPKPWHGLREFLKEYAIIVLGVLTALALEQSVEWLHWREVVNKDKLALTSMSESMYVGELGRVDQQICIDRRLADIALVIKRHAAGVPLGMTGPVGRPSSWSTYLGAFDMAIADQSLSHMEEKEKEDFYAVRGSFNLFSENEDKELTAWRTLRTLDDSADFTPADWEEVRKAYRQAEDLNGVMRTNLASRRDGDWLRPFTFVSRPAQKDVSLRMMPWVKQLCSGAIVS